MEKTFVFVRNSGALLGVALGGLMGLASPALAQDVRTDRVVVAQNVVVSPRIVAPPQQNISVANARVGRPVYAGGGIGGAIGGYYVNGSTRADNSALPGGVWPYR